MACVLQARHFRVGPDWTSAVSSMLATPVTVPQAALRRGFDVRSGQMSERRWRIAFAVVCATPRYSHELSATQAISRPRSSSSLGANTYQSACSCRRGCRQRHDAHEKPEYARSAVAATWPNSPFSVTTGHAMILHLAVCSIVPAAVTVLADDNLPPLLGQAGRRLQRLRLYTERLALPRPLAPHYVTSLLVHPGLKRCHLLPLSSPLPPPRRRQWSSLWLGARGGRRGDIHSAP